MGICTKRKRIRFALRDLISLRKKFPVFAFAQSVRNKLSQIKEISPKNFENSSKEPHLKFRFYSQFLKNFRFASHKKKEISLSLRFAEKF